MKFESKDHELAQIDATIFELKRALDDMYRYRTEILLEMKEEKSNELRNDGHCSSHLSKLISYTGVM